MSLAIVMLRFLGLVMPGLWQAGQLSAAAKAHERKPSMRMVVQLCNPAIAPSFELTKAELVASGLYSGAGIKIQWLEPPKPAREASNDPLRFRVGIVNVAPSHVPEFSMGVASPNPR